MTENNKITGLKELGHTPESADKRIAEMLTLEKRMSDGVFDYAPIDDVVRICRLVNNSKITSRFLERWIANYIGGKTNPVSSDGKDYGDIIVGANIIGRDNIELKASEKDDRYVIGGGQCRFFENIPYYIFLQFQQGGNNYFDLYLLSKEEIHNEIFEEEVCRCNPSQVSGQTKTISEGKVKKMSDDQVRQLVQETFEGKNNILWNFSIDSHISPFEKKEPKLPTAGTKASALYPTKLEKYLKAKERHQKKIDTLDRWNSKYKVTVEELKNWKNFLKTRYGI